MTDSDSNFGYFLIREEYLRKNTQNAVSMCHLSFVLAFRLLGGFLRRTEEANALPAALPRSAILFVPTLNHGADKNAVAHRMFSRGLCPFRIGLVQIATADPVGLVLLALGFDELGDGVLL